MVRSLVASCLAFAGVWLLAGPGWALLAGALLVFVLWPAGAETELARAGRRASALARQAMAAPRRAVAMTTAAGGLALLPVGLALATGIGIAVATAGGLLIAGGLLTGWNA
jgi:hypothetical protein